MNHDSLTLGEFLKYARNQKALTLRAVEQLIAVSNAYLSQLEGNKIKRPSPTILHQLAELYELAYDDVLALAGYPTSSPALSTPSSRIGPVTPEEEEALVEYLQFLRQRRPRGRTS